MYLVDAHNTRATCSCIADYETFTAVWLINIQSTFHLKLGYSTFAKYCGIVLSTYCSLNVTLSVSLTVPQGRQYTI